MSEQTKWTVSNTCKLIEMYRETPLLWDATNSDYKNRYKKADALNEIGRSLNVCADEIERKLKNINSQYQRERRNYRQCKESGSGKKFISKWFGYTLLGFLKDKTKPRKSQNADGGLSFIDVQQLDDSYSSAEEEEVKIKVISDNSNDAGTEVLLPVPQPVNVSFSNELSTATKNTVDKGSDEIYSMVKSVHHNWPERRSDQRDDFDVFGEIVARKLRNLETRYAQITLQHLINNLLYEGELGNYDSP